MTLKTLIIGHSICYWLANYIQSGRDERLLHDFDLARISEVHFKGERGRTVKEMIQNDFHVIDKLRPDILIFIIGGNDVSYSSSPQEIALYIIAMCSMVHSRFNVRQVVICSLLPRFSQLAFRFYNRGLRGAHLTEAKRRDRQFKKYYCAQASLVNNKLRTEANKYAFITFWAHNNQFPFPETFGRHCRDKFSSDGVHMSNKGQYHLYKSLRGAIIGAVSRIVQ